RDFHVTGVQTCALPIFGYLRGYESMHWFRLGEAEIMLHPGGKGTPPGAPVLHAAVTDVGKVFDRAREQGLTPVDHEAPDEPLTRSEENTSELQSRENLVCR